MAGRKERSKSIWVRLMVQSCAVMGSLGSIHLGSYDVQH